MKAAHSVGSPEIGEAFETMVESILQNANFWNNPKADKTLQFRNRRCK
jgi:hypothetical protein